jgi:plasmid maintenance system antidote protein VapI
MTRAVFANELGISKAQLYNLIGNRRRLTLEVASKLGKVTNRGSAFWLQLELDHRLYSNGIR